LSSGQRYAKSKLSKELPSLLTKSPPEIKAFLIVSFISWSVFFIHKINLDSQKQVDQPPQRFELTMQALFLKALPEVSQNCAPDFGHRAFGLSATPV
jgi:hypothetical protein